MNRHGFDPLSLVAGLLFAGLGAAFLAGNVRLSNMDLTWLWPLAIIALGVVLVVGIGNRQSESPDNDAGDDDENSTAAAGRDVT